MDQSKPRILFFAGTDTDVGKTYIAALAARELHHNGRRVGVYKPVASGCHWVGDELVSDDASKLWDAAGRNGRLQDVCPQRFVAPLAPPVAAMLEGRSVDESLLLSGIGTIAAHAEVVIVEGAGGLMSPLSHHLLNSDLAKRLKAQLIVVASNRVGVIHQVLATVTAASALKLPVVGIILNRVSPDFGIANDQNAETIKRFTSVPILADISFGAVASGIDWNALPPPMDVPSPIAQAWL